MTLLEEYQALCDMTPPPSQISVRVDILSALLDLWEAAEPYKTVSVMCSHDLYVALTALEKLK